MIKPQANGLTPINTDQNIELQNSLYLFELKALIQTLSNKGSIKALNNIIEKILRNALFDNPAKQYGILLLKNFVKSKFFLLNSDTILESDRDQRTVGEVQANYSNNIFENILLFYLQSYSIPSQKTVGEESYGSDLSIASKKYEIKSISEYKTKVHVFINDETIKNKYPLIILFPNKIVIVQDLESYQFERKINSNRNQYLLYLDINNPEQRHFDTLDQLRLFLSSHSLI